MKAPPSLAELRLRPHWSCSSIRTFIDICALQWAFRYILRQPPEKESSALVFGKAFHGALTWWFSPDHGSHRPAVAEAVDVFTQLLARAWAEVRAPVSFRAGQTAESLAVAGRGMIGAYLETVDPAEDVIAVAEAFGVVMQDARGEPLGKPLIGEYDMVVRSPSGDEIIVDWKTSAARWGDAKAATDLQPTCYLLARRQAGHTPTQFRFDVMTKTKTPGVQRLLTDREPSAFTRLAEIVKLVESMVCSGHIIPNDRSFACADCPYAGACRRWQGGSTHFIPMAA